MSWLYSRARVEEYSAASCSGGEPSAQLSETPTLQAYCSQDRMTDFSRLSRFGMTFAPLTDDLGADVLTWYLAGSPARTSARPERGPESPESAADCGWKWRESSVKYDPAMRLWKTRQCSLFEGSEWFSETWPRWGSMRDGECWERPMSERPTYARGFGLLPTIRAQDGERGGRGDLIQAVRGNPNSHYKLWPTPQARDHFPAHTPEYIAAKKAQGHGMSNLNDRVGGQLNPTWVEWLMGWPLGWTAFAPLGMGKSQLAPLRLGAR
nr:hypothetical protein [uncultured Thiodictyon sp.]